MINLIGYACGIAANDSGCCMGPLRIQNSRFLADLNIHWRDMLYPRESEAGLAAIPVIVEVCTRLAQETHRLASDGQAFAVIGGDHTSAIGTWGGVSGALKSKGDLGLIWIDAHMDSHTPQTTITGNVHGMPLAVLLGQGQADLCQILEKSPRLKPDNVCLIGTRNYEPAEAELLKKLGVRIFYMEEVNQRGLNDVMQEAINIANQNTAGFGVSIDLDAIDPSDAPGVGCPAVDGLRAQEFCSNLQKLKNHPKLLGIEITEFNPYLDKDQKTEKLIADILKEIYT